MFLLQVWTDWKTTIRKKIAHNKAEVRATGGGEYSCQMLSVTEERIAVLCSIYVAVDGIENATAFGTFLEEEEVIPESPPKEPTPKRSTTSTPQKDTNKRARVANLQECVKEHMGVEGTAVASIASTLK